MDSNSQQRYFAAHAWIVEGILLIPWLLLITSLISARLFVCFPIAMFLLLPTGILVGALQAFKGMFRSKLSKFGLDRLHVRVFTVINTVSGTLGWMLIYVVTS